jgi:hypothetical protein
VADRPPPGQRGGCCRSGVDVAIGRRRADGAIWPDCDTPVVTQQPSDRAGRRISPDTQVRDMHGGGGGHTVDTVWTQSHLSRVSQGKAICAAQNGFSCLTRTTPNGSSPTGGTRITAAKCLLFASKRGAQRRPKTEDTGGLPEHPGHPGPSSMG